MASLKRDLVRTYEELHSNFAEYINCNKLSKKLKINYRTAREYVKTLQSLKLFNKPMCEWHDEAISNFSKEEKRHNIRKKKGSRKTINWY